MKTLSLMPVSTPPDLRLALPGSKSFANRAIVCAALAGAPCVIANVSPGDDTALMLNVLADLGWRVSRPHRLSADVILTPSDKPFVPPHEAEIHTGPAGTATRFACALLTVTPGRFVLDGNARMRERPMAPLIGALRELGAKIEERGAPGCVPVAIEGGSLRGGRCRLRGDVSSQFLSALLLVAPTRGAGVEIEIEGELVSRSYAEVTLSVMRAFGVDSVKRDGWRRLTVAPAAYGAGQYVCPPDATAAGYFWGAAAVTGGRCVIDGLARQDAQGDVALVDIFERMGCDVLEFPNGLGVQGPAVGELRSVEADLTDLPDSAQTLAVVCAFARGTSRLTGLGTLRVKETDRIAALEAELAKLGASTRAGEDWLEIDGPAGPPQTPPVIATYDDHHMAMSFAIAGLRAPLKIADPGCVSKSFPGFWESWISKAGGGS